MVRRRAVVLVLASVLLAAACTSGGDDAATATTTTSAPRVQVPAETLQARVDALLRESGAPGAIAGVVVHGGTPTIVASGVDAHTKAPLATGDSFRIASITKTFVGALALQLVADGKLALDDPVATYVPDWPRGDELTIEMLLSHTSGLAPWGADSGAPGPYAQQANDFALGHYGKPVTPAEILDIVRDRPLLFEPGSSTAYSNINTILLGHIVSTIARRTLGTELHERLLDPLHLRSTHYAPEEPTPTPVAGLGEIAGPGSQVDTGPIDYTAVMGMLGAAGGMVSTVEDLLAWGDAFLRSHRALPKALADEAFRVRPGGTGLGVVGMTTNADLCVFAPDGCPTGAEFRAYGGSGLVDGAQTLLLYNPATDAVVVAFVNRDHVPGLNGFVADVLSEVESRE